MRRFIKRLRFVALCTVFVLLLTSFFLGFCSCDKDENEGEETPPEDNGTPTQNDGDDNGLPDIELPIVPFP